MLKNNNHNNNTFSLILHQFPLATFSHLLLCCFIILYLAGSHNIINIQSVLPQKKRQIYVSIASLHAWVLQFVFYMSVSHCAFLKVRKL